jgi:hypothetical protein
MIYELKDKILDVYAEFASDEEKAKLNAKLEQVEVSQMSHYILAMILTLLIGLAIR